MAYNAGLNVVAFGNLDNVLMNITVPLISGSYSTNMNTSLMPYYMQHSPMTFRNILSQENVEVRMAIYHEGIFSNSTTYKMTPVWTNSP